ncbi:MAG: DUF2184 domain-containing protein [Oscillospiraceae bacterium]|nr:DUF2184 domain-containing protein [Oscillospiraceae bacterium]
MSKFQNVGTFDAGVIGAAHPGRAAPGVMTLDEAGIASGGAFLRSELEKRDPLVRKPLTSFTYPRDININTGGGWVDAVSAQSVGYGLTGGSGDGPVGSGGANGIPIVSANVDSGIYKAHVFQAALRVMFVDMQKANYIGRSLDSLLSDGMRMAYDKHQDQNVYLGFARYGTTGILNHPDAAETQVPAGASGSTQWSKKTPDEILSDVNAAIAANWAAAEYDESAMPNHILIPYEQYTDILTRKVTELASGTILDFLLRNNASAKNGGSLFIGPCRHCKGMGTGGSDRMAVYVNHERFISAEELVPLSRAMTSPNAAEACYDTVYMANLSEVEVFYPQTLSYYDGI